MFTHARHMWHMRQPSTNTHMNPSACRCPKRRSFSKPPIVSSHACRATRSTRSPASTHPWATGGGPTRRRCTIRPSPTSSSSSACACCNFKAARGRCCLWSPSSMEADAAAVDGVLWRPPPLGLTCVGAGRGPGGVRRGGWSSK